MLKIAPWPSAPNTYGYTDKGNSTIYLTARSKAWRADYQQYKPNRFMRRVGAVLSHETIHLVIARLESWEASKRLDKVAGKFYTDITDVHGVFT
jgi:hypothetical protein